MKFQCSQEWTWVIILSDNNAYMHHSAYSTAQMTNYEQLGIRYQGRDVWGGCFLKKIF